MAFYLKDYEITLKKFLKLSGRNWMTISEAKEAIDLKSKTLNKALIFRHDVDREPYKALKMAKIEANFNIKATYYFRCNKGDFPVPFVDKISKLGHEVGYHYECLSSSNGDKNKALKIFKKNLLRFRSIAPCTSVSMHGKPLSPYNNQDLLVTKIREKMNVTV